MIRHWNKHTYVVGALLMLLLLVSLKANRSSAHKEAEVPAAEDSNITPAGTLLLDATTRQPAVGALPVALVRSPDHTGQDRGGRYLISVNSGFGLQFNAGGNRAQQSLSVIDLDAEPAPMVVQNVHFPSPQSVNVGVVFSPLPEPDGSYALYVSGGFENKIWIFRFLPGAKMPVSPASPGTDAVIEAPFIDVDGFATAAPTRRYNKNQAPIYPTGLAISPDGNTLFVANNLGDSLGIVTDLRGARKLEVVPLIGKNRQPAQAAEHFTYPYAVVAIPHGPLRARDLGELVLLPSARQSAPVRIIDPASKAYVSCWNDSSVAVLNLANKDRQPSYISVGQHPTAMLWDGTRSLLYVTNSGDDTVSVIDTRYDREVERINIRLAEGGPLGNTPEGLAISNRMLYVANAHSNSVAVVQLSKRAGGGEFVSDGEKRTEDRENEADRSTVRGFIPTGNYPSAVAVVGKTIFIGNGKGTGVENSSVVVDNSGRAPNAPNDRFPTGTGRGLKQGGQYSVSLVGGNISVVRQPNDPTLASYTQQVMRNNRLIGSPKVKLFSGASPIKHVIYVIKENRTYDQVFGDLKQSGDGAAADGESSLAIFGSGDAAKSPHSVAQDIAPNHRALALRFGLFDRFFVNSEASPDGHNWSTAAFSSDYVDKAYRWQYGDRGRSYDYEGFNRLPEYNPVRGQPSMFGPTVSADEIANFMRGYVPYLHGSRDVAEPETLYLWDAAAKAGLTYRNYGEFIATVSEAEVMAIRNNKARTYPDLSPTVTAFPTKKSLEGHHSISFRNFDLNTPDAMTVESYRAARESAGKISPLVSAAPGQRFPGASRLGAWLEEFQEFVAARDAGKPDQMPNLSILRLSNDHTDGLAAGKPTPQFFVADNDYAVGLLVDVVSHSPYWKDTAIFMVEDDAQDGPDHVDAHRSVTLVISAYNRPGLLTHTFHNTVSLIRTMELLLGIAPMNQLDANAVPMDIFRAQPDLRPYSVELPNVALDNLITPRAADGLTAYWMRRSAEQNMSHPDMADPAILNQIIWFSVKRNLAMPSISRLPAFDAMKLGLAEERDDERRELAKAGKAERDD